MVTWNAGSDAFFTPAVLGMVDAAEACLILEHKAHFSTAPVEIFQFTDGGFNFFEVSMTSLLAFLGCLLRGMTFLQPVSNNRINMIIFTIKPISNNH